MFDPTIDIFKQPLMKLAISPYEIKRLSWDGTNSTYKVIFEEFKIKNNQKMSIDLFPDGYATIFFRTDLETKKTKAFYFEKMLTTNQITFKPKSSYFTIRIPPCCLFKNTLYPPSYYINKTVSLHEWIPKFQSFNSERLINLSFSNKILFFQNYVKNYISYETNYIVSYVLKNAAKNNQITIKKLANDLKVSDRYIRKVFNKELGISPKPMIQAVRLQKILAILEKSNRLTDIFISSDFYDQSHLTKFMKEATLYLPKDLKKLIE